MPGSISLPAKDKHPPFPPLLPPLVPPLVSLLLLPLRQMATLREGAEVLPTAVPTVAAVAAVAVAPLRVLRRSEEKGTEEEVYEMETEKRG